jgi:hypothetical protein
MANTTNFGWETPDDTDLVKDGAAAIRTLGQAIDTSLVDLEGGTTGQVLAKNSNTDMDFIWVTSDDANAIQNAIVDAKGDIVAASANDTPARLAVGTDNHRLIAASGETTGLKYVADTQNTVIDAEGDLLVGDAADALQRLAIGSNAQVLTVDTSVDGKIKWATPAGGSTFSGVNVRLSASVSLTNNAGVIVNFDTETIDTDGYHSTVSNTSRLTVPAGKAGKFLVGCIGVFASNNNGYRNISFRKNGTDYLGSISSAPAASANSGVTILNVYSLAEADYIEIDAFQNSGGSLNLVGGTNDTYFYMIYLGA